MLNRNLQVLILALLTTITANAQVNSITFLSFNDFLTDSCKIFSLNDFKKLGIPNQYIKSRHLPYGALFKINRKEDYKISNRKLPPTVPQLIEQQPEVLKEFLVSQFGTTDGNLTYESCGMTHNNQYYLRLWLNSSFYDLVLELKMQTLKIWILQYISCDFYIGKVVNQFDESINLPIDTTTSNP